LTNMEINEIENFYIKYGPMVLRRCRFLLKSEEKAQDAMQEVFVKILSKKEKLESSFPSSLLYTMATNVCLNIIKAEKANQKPENSDDDLVSKIASSENFVDRILTNDLINRIFQAEPVSTREMAVMHYVDGLTLEETARECGMSVSGIRKRLRKLGERVKVWQEKEGNWK